MIAIGLDSADAPLVRRLIDSGELPNLGELERLGGWASVRPAPGLGSVAGWGSFLSGKQPEEHGLHTPWAWDPSSMGVVLHDSSHLRPFWGHPGRAEGIGALDVPYAHPTSAANAFQVVDFGPHDAVLEEPHVRPAALAAEIPELAERHVLWSRALRPTRADDPVHPATLVSACVAGAEHRGRVARRLIEQTRPEMALVVFSELHHCSHELWHTVEEGSTDGPGLLEVYREVDVQVGHLVRSAGPGEPVMAFSLIGMRAGRGIAQLLHPVMAALGYTAAARRGARSNGDLARSALSAAKRHMPAAIAREYHRRLPRRLRQRLARPTLMPPIAWEGTTAFALPSDQHGYVRVNLRGREAEGTVAPEDYPELREELAARLGALTGEHGEPLVAEVIRLGSGTSPPHLLPDLALIWTEAALADPVRVKGIGVSARPGAMRLTGQHRGEGFLVGRGIDPPPSRELDPVELRELLLTRTPA